MLLIYRVDDYHEFNRIWNGTRWIIADLSKYISHDES
jgi:hypothetical protein